MAHVLHSFARRVEKSAQRRRMSRRLQAFLRDPHLAKDIGRPSIPTRPGKPELW